MDLVFEGRSDIPQLFTHIIEHFSQPVGVDAGGFGDSQFCFQFPFGPSQGKPFVFHQFFESQNNRKVFFPEYFVTGACLSRLDEVKFFFPSFDDFCVKFGDTAHFLQLVNEFIGIFTLFHLNVPILGLATWCMLRKINRYINMEN